MLKSGVMVVTITFAIVLSGCTKNKTASVRPSSTPAPINTKTAGPLADGGFKAEVTAAEPPTKLRAGQVEVINIKVKNISNVIWWQRGGELNDRSDNKFYIAAGNRWLDKDGKLSSETEGHNGIPKDLKPGEETEMPLQITAPKTPGDWTLNLDMVQEGVAWFGEKGSPTTKIKVMVVK
ncbi:MAG TPA: hypothetical protein VJ372_05285 [Pyrinomonadaceae bacterium]|jgi:hypothetical protein|nr:hypothetical protein [Pyrinomonadaceae bacterium]